MMYQNLTMDNIKEKNADISYILHDQKFNYLVCALDKVVMWEKVHFDVIFIGDDWKGDPRWKQTEEDLEPFGVRVIYLPHTPGVSSTELRTEQSKTVAET